MTITKLKKEELEMLNPMMGADPEFMITDSNGDHIRASDLFYPSGMIGCDGCDAVGELRPTPYRDVRFLVKGIKDLFVEIKKGLSTREGQSFNLYAGQYVNGFPIGGHIHISMNKEEWFVGEVVNRLDKILLDVVSPKIDNITQLQDRLNGGYGKRSNRNMVSYGIEYRSTGSWLLSPEIAIMYLGLAKMAYQSVVLDLPSYVSAEKTFISYAKSYASFTDDVKLALSLFSKIVAKNTRINWDVDILNNWVKGEQPCQVT